MYIHGLYKYDMFFKKTFLNSKWLILRNLDPYFVFISVQQDCRRVRCKRSRGGTASEFIQELKKIFLCSKILIPGTQFVGSECQTFKDSLAVTLHRRKKRTFLKTTAPKWMRSSSASGINKFLIRIR